MYRTIFNFRQPMQLLLLFLMGLLLSGCPQHAFQTDQTPVAQTVSAHSSYYLSQAEQSSGSAKYNWWLLAAQALINEGDVNQAEQLLTTLPSNLSTAQKQEVQLLRAELNAAKYNSTAALQALNEVNVTDLSDGQKIRYYRAKANASSADPLEQLRAYIELEHYGNESQRHQAINETWQVLVNLPRSSLNQLVINADEYTLQGWLDLLRVQQDNQAEIELLQAAVKEWQIRYPSNPAAKYLPRTIFGEAYRLPDNQQSLNVALFLPLSGASRSLSQAIIDGFNDGMVPPVNPADEHLAQLRKISLEQQSANYVKIYDTTSQPLSELLIQAEKEGAQFIVGPLFKNRVEEIVKLETTLPILALNEPENIISKTNVCYFALSPEDEAEDAARYIRSQHKQKPLVIAPTGELGRRVALAFAQTWQKNGGDGAVVQYFSSYQQLKQSMNRGIGIAVSGDLILPKVIAEAITDSEEAVMIPPAKPVEIDAIYVVAYQDELTLIKPMLDMKSKQVLIADDDEDGPTYSNISTSQTQEKPTPPIYASSRSHSPGAGPDFRFEMDGVQFSEIPLLAGSYPSVLDTLPSYMKEDYRLIRLYALGMDAWRLVQDYSAIHNDTNYRYEGKTGEITMNSQCVIHLKPSWQQYKNGELISAY